MDTEQIRALLRIKRIIDQLRAVDLDTLTPTEREAWLDMLAQAYERADYILRTDSILKGQSKNESIHLFTCFH